MYLERPRLHVLRRHLQLVLSESEESAQCDTRIGYNGLASAEKLKVVSFLQDGAIACRNIQAGKHLVRTGKEG